MTAGSAVKNLLGSLLAPASDYPGTIFWIDQK